MATFWCQCHGVAANIKATAEKSKCHIIMKRTVVRVFVRLDGTALSTLQIVFMYCVLFLFEFLTNNDVHRVKRCEARR